MKYCRICVQPNTRPSMFFSEDDICGACLYEEDKKKIDWDSREKELDEIVKWAKKTTNTAYDCVIGVSGGKDSTFQALYARDKLGLRVLLVNSEPEAITEIGRSNIENLINLGFDTIKLRPNPKIMKKLIKRDFFKYMNPLKITEYSLWSSAYIAAEVFNVPLIIQGENPVFTLGADLEVGADGNAINTDRHNTLLESLSAYIDDTGINEKDLFLFNYNKKKLISDNVKAIWLQYYAKEWSQIGNPMFSVAHGLTVRPKDFNPTDVGTFVRCSRLDSPLSGMNQMLKYVKFGFGQATDDVCYAIREGAITRNQGIKLIQLYDGKVSPDTIKMFCNYININIDIFWNEVNKWRGEMWEKNENNIWNLIHPIWEQEGIQENVDVTSVMDQVRHNYFGAPSFP